MKWKQYLPWSLLLLFAVGYYSIPRSSEHASNLNQIISPESQLEEVLSPSSQAAFSYLPVGNHPKAAATAAGDPLAEIMRRDCAGLTVTEHADGRKSINLGGRFQHVTQLVALPDGRKIPRCFGSYQEMSEQSKIHRAPRNERPIPSQAEY